MSGSLKRRLVAAAALWVLALTLAGGFALAMAFRASVTRAFDDGLEGELRSLIAGIDTGADGTWWLKHRPDDPRFESIYAGRYWQIDDPSGRTERSRSLWDTGLSTSAGESPGASQPVTLDGPAGQPLRGLRQTIALPRLDRPLTFLIAQSRQTLDAEVAHFNRLLALALGVLAFGFLLAVWLQVGYGLRPLKRMTAELRQVRAGRKESLATLQPIEVQPLVDELESVLAHNRRLVERTRSSAADLAHALKTPLSVMAAELHAPGENWRTVLQQELERTRGLVNRYLGRSAIAGAGRGRRTDITPIIVGLLSAMRRIHADRNIDFSIDAPCDLVFAGEREDLEEMLGNLIDNAGKWAGSRVLVRARGESSENLQIDVDDDGPGIAPEHHSDALARGRRFDEMTPGSGLGLSIVGDIVESYGGELRLSDSVLGGLRASLILPAAPM
jgi:signal transduction histidine kinase